MALRRSQHNGKPRTPTSDKRLSAGYLSESRISMSAIRPTCITRGQRAAQRRRLSRVVAKCFPMLRHLGSEATTPYCGTYPVRGPSRPCNHAQHWLIPPAPATASTKRSSRSVTARWASYSVRYEAGATLRSRSRPKRSRTTPTATLNSWRRKGPRVPADDSSWNRRKPNFLRNLG
jgi:hypothetical protein